MNVPHLGYLRAKKNFYDGMGFKLDEHGRIIEERNV